MEDESHPLDQLLIGADHAVQPPAVIFAPGVGRIERFARFIDGFGAGERRRSRGTGEAEHHLLQGLAHERLGLSGSRSKTRAPQQSVRLLESDRRGAQRGRRYGGRSRG